MEYKLDINQHLPVGPYTDVYGHGPVTLIGPKRDGRDDTSGSIVACLDCGYTSNDIRLLLDEDCNREDNPITQTWRERLEEEEF